MKISTACVLLMQTSLVSSQVRGASKLYGVRGLRKLHDQAMGGGGMGKDEGKKKTEASMTGEDTFFSELECKHSAG